VNLESCIFSGNQTIYSAGNDGGGAIYNSNGGNLVVKGCTFYKNSSAKFGGAILAGGNSSISTTVLLTGNLFYGNTAASFGPVVYKLSSTTGSIVSTGYNVVDVTLGTGTDQSGFSASNNIGNIISLPISPVSFRPFAGGGATNVITTLPAGYPTVDFYGNPISNGAASGAVQGTAGGAGNILTLSVNNAALGSVSALPPPDADGFVSSTTVTAAPMTGYTFAYWLQDGVNIGNANQLSLNLTAHTTLQAVFGRVVNNFAADSATTPGTLRYALTNAQNGEAIICEGVTPGVTTITLESALPPIEKSLTIQGNGITLTRAASTTVDAWSQLLRIPNTSGYITVNISRIHFKDGRATAYGAAIHHGIGTLTLESCIFSGNQNSGSDGGAIYTSGPLVLRGCTFYENSSAGSGGAVYNVGSSSYGTDGVTTTLTGNLFYGNTAASGPVVSRYTASIYAKVASSRGYNVVDVTLGAGDTQSGFAAASGDSTFINRGISGDPFDTTTGDTAFTPNKAALNIVPANLAGFPLTDFYGNARTFPGAPGAVRTPY
jgi:predicted outer membrane repeat protein